MLNLAITNLKKYNEGELIYEWIELPFEHEELKELFDKIGHDEYFISDYETDLNIHVSEYASLSRINKNIKDIEFIDEHEKRCLNAILDVLDYSLEESIKVFESESYIFYDCNDYLELAESLVDEGYFGEIPDHLTNYIDYKAIARDLKYDFMKTEYGMIAIE